jgi:hypothetical protein
MLEYMTIGWNSLEAIGSIVVGLLAGSIALIGFGLDSLIEVSCLEIFPDDRDVK